MAASCWCKRAMFVGRMAIVAEPRERHAGGTRTEREPREAGGATRTRRNWGDLWRARNGPPLHASSMLVINSATATAWATQPTHLSRQMLLERIRCNLIVVTGQCLWACSTSVLPITFNTLLYDYNLMYEYNEVQLDNSVDQMCTRCIACIALRSITNTLTTHCLRPHICGRAHITCSVQYSYMYASTEIPYTGKFTCINGICTTYILGLI